MGNQKSLLEKHGYKLEKAEEEAGKGGFGKITIVQSVQSKKDGKKMAIKEVLLNEMARKDVSVLQSMKHPNIVHYLDSFEEEGKLYMVMEYCDGGDLSKKIEDQKETGMYFQESKIIGWFVQTCQALKYVHDKGLIHRNIKPQNIFWTEAGEIKLGDLKCQRADGYADIIAGILYIAPEILRHQSYTNKRDMWSLGRVLYELCMLKKPMAKHSILKSYSSELQGLLRELLKKNPADRPSVKDVLKKPFIKHHITQCNTTKVQFQRRPTGTLSQQCQFTVTKNPEIQAEICITDNDCILTEWSADDAIDAYEHAVLMLKIHYEETFKDLQDVVNGLYDLANQLEIVYKNSTIGSLSGGVFGAAGGITSIVGLALTPVTLGASLIVTGVGIGVAFAGGVGGAASNVSGMVQQTTIKKTIEENYKTFERTICPMITSLSEIESCNTYLNETNRTSSTTDSTSSTTGNTSSSTNNTSSSTDNTLTTDNTSSTTDNTLSSTDNTSSTAGQSILRTGKALAVIPETVRLVQVASIGRVAAQAAKTVRVASALTGVLSGLFLIMDVAFIAVDAREIHEMNNGEENPKSQTLKLLKGIRDTAAHYEDILKELKSSVMVITLEE